MLIKTTIGKIAPRNIDCTIEISTPADKPSPVLSICGTIGHGRECIEAGQIADTLRASLEHIIYMPSWNENKLLDFLGIWDEWHLNNMRAGCEHQRKWKWTHCPGHYSEPGTDIDRANRDLKQTGIALIHGFGRHYYCTDSDAPTDGPKCTGSIHKLCTPCPICKYEYGSAWLFEPIPQSVLDWLTQLEEPCTEKS